MDIESIRSTIPALRNSIYLNTGTFGPMPTLVTQEMTKAYEMVGEFGAFSQIVRQKIERDGYESARASAVKLLNVTPDQLALTRSASDGICIIAYGLDWKAGDEVVVTDQEHPNGELPWINLHKRFGVEVRVVQIADDPNVTMQRFAEAITDRTRLVFASHVCSSTGERLPAHEIRELAHDKGKLAAIDGSHALGQFTVDFQEIKPDFYIACGDKWLLGPQGTGMLYIAPEQVVKQQNDPATYAADFSEVRGQEHAKRALEIAAAGQHNGLMTGPPGAGKTPLARSMPSILPELALDAALEVTRIYSVSDMLPRETPLVRQRPFRAPHHTISHAGLVGGGRWPRPGEISLAHRGVLFLDELPEFDSRSTEVLRQPLDNGFRM